MTRLSAAWGRAGLTRLVLGESGPAVGCSRRCLPSLSGRLASANAGLIAKYEQYAPVVDGVALRMYRTQAHIVAEFQSEQIMGGLRVLLDGIEATKG
jgi:hypothetical protein